MNIQLKTLAAFLSFCFDIWNEETQKDCPDNERRNMALDAINACGDYLEKNGILFDFDIVKRLTNGELRDYITGFTFAHIKKGANNGKCNDETGNHSKIP